MSSIVTATGTAKYRRRAFEPYSPLKRGGDILVSTVLLAVLAPLFAGICMAVIVIDRNGPFYRDLRVGLNGRQFPCLKFRTMRRDQGVLETYLAAHPDEAEQYATCRKLSRDPRITRLGSFLRRTSIDELPQLWNVFTGQMSLVGPRPITAAELQQRPDSDQAWIMNVRPGMTGLWQVSGRCELSPAQRVELDSQYAQDWSVGMDVRILLQTPVAVLRARGAR